MTWGYFLKLAVYTLFFLILSSGWAGADKVVYLSSLEWPPYTGKYLSENGESAKIVRKAFASMGYRLEIHFVPWKRAMWMAEKDSRVVGYFPEYYSPERAKTKVFSDSYARSALGLVVRRRDPLQWDKIDDLAGYKIGFVSGYVNTMELDNAIANGTFGADFAPNDESNLLKVSRGRVAAAVIDPYVFNYIIEKSPNALEINNTLVMSPDSFGVNELFVAFTNNTAGRRFVRIFNEGLKKIKAAGYLGGSQSLNLN